MPSAQSEAGCRKMLRDDAHPWGSQGDLASRVRQKKLEN